MIPLLTLKETADWLRCHNSSLYRMVKARSIPFFRVGTDLRFDPQRVQQWMIYQSKETMAFRSTLTRILARQHHLGKV